MNISKKFLTLNRYSRPGRQISEVKGIVFHWVAGPGQNARQVWSYFESLKNQKNGSRFASAHFTIDPKEIVQNLPLNEMAYHVGAQKYNQRVIDRLKTNYPNNCLIGIELCHSDWTGKPESETLEKAVELGVYLMKKFNLGPDRIFRHFDITFKKCPKFFVKNNNEWVKFYKRIQEQL